VDALVALALAVGAVGTVLPLVPGILLSWAATLAYGLVEGFDGTGAVAFGVITVIAAAATVAGWVIPARVAGKAGAARSSILLGVVGAVAGFFVIPVVGLAVGGVAGVYAGERVRTGDGALAWRATKATVTGFGLATLLQFVAALAIAAVWAVWAFA
jgi:uncharacterized protein YqgC (DUF456 family)